MLKVYRILSYILLPVGLLFGLMALIGLLIALGNLAALLPVFMVAATVIYIFASFKFLNRVIDGHQTASRSLHDWVRVNGFVAMFFAISTIMQTIALANNQALLNEVMDQAMEMQKMPVPKAMVMKTMKAVLYVMLGISIILAVHVTMGLRLLKQFKDWFIQA